MSFPQFALRVRARQERLVASLLSSKGYDIFLPTHRCRRRWSDRVKEIEVPLFPGYLFCRLDLEKRLPVLTTPGVVDLVRAGRDFVPVDEIELAAIRSIVASSLPAQPWPFLQIGQTVRIDHGPLVGLEGVLLALKKPYRLVVSVSLLQRSVAVEIDHDWVKPVGPRHLLTSTAPDHPFTARPAPRSASPASFRQ